ncbi:hypothetical protein GTGU_04359 [Trabulsiella guamensis ATCC 49490]|uniref:Tetratricopeptide repeat protein n=1 Tax=Trabulsiella guamensis ATCC 49490 TaxID=1005994 RepID=A0A084ZN63_9ENTR|nr:hypothetical protein [Trabulsiella guamensis]KFB98907.1 hypothetical protein GTGU_04359 [Trabulsiella guamensis ATCC 49490]
MSLINFDNNRVLAPSWLRSEDAAYSAELRALTRNTAPASGFSGLEYLKELFLRQPGLDIAIELLSVSYTENAVDISRQAAAYIIETKKQIPLTLSNFCHSLLQEQQTKTIINDNIHSQIRDKKIWLRNHPNDCLSWMDLSRLYMSIGQIGQAEKAIITGLGLSVNNRWVTRASSRFFFNLEDYERSHDILVKHPDIKNDPWLLASELAISNAYGRNSRYWSHSKKVLEFGYYPYHISELQSSIGTLELQSGAVKKAKVYFGNSLKCPNGNVFAQAKWAERKGNIRNLVQHEDLIKQPRAFEAKYQEAYCNRDMELALHFAKKWQEEEPFNQETAIQASYIASLLDDYEQAQDISQKGLQINPNDETLKLNLMFSSISLEHAKENKLSGISFTRAISIVTDMLKNEDNDSYPHAIANMGLLYYKSGDLEKGKRFYELATEHFKKKNNRSFVLCELNHLREALISDSPWKEELFRMVETSVKSGGVWNEPCVSFYISKLQKIRLSPDNWWQRLTEKNEQMTDNTEKQSFSRNNFDFSNKSPTIWLPGHGRNKK